MSTFLNPVEDFVEIGHIQKAHGLKGELIFEPTFTDLDLYTTLSLVYVQTLNGMVLPKRIMNIRPATHKGKTSFFVILDQVNDRSTAEPFSRTTVYLTQEQAEELGFIEDEDPLESLAEYTYVNEEDNTSGAIYHVFDNGAQAVIEIESLGFGNLMVPLVERYVADIDHEEGVIYLQNLSDFVEDEEDDEQDEN